MIRFWRGYSITFEADGQLGLKGSYKRDAWKSGTLTANCSNAIEEDLNVTVQPAPQAPVARDGIDFARSLYVGQMLQPQPQAVIRRVRFNDNKKAYERQCEDHLLGGGWGCSCGIWGYKRPTDLEHNYLPNYWTASMHSSNNLSCNRYAPPLKALAACIGWGAFVEGKRGYRVQYAKIERLYLPVLPCNENLPVMYRIYQSAIAQGSAQMSFTCSHDHVQDYDIEVPIDPQKCAKMLTAQFNAPAITCTPHHVMHNIVANSRVDDDDNDDHE